ncbi:lecithin retinol acyltransferase family protein [Ralstonia pseudosolanacearum]|uniref:lecithin retinol acyltransferase family protein n=1 Tax=Ralstonia pseudosolanacearum TaxID=1310165 RepID=UPI0018D1C54C|nr:lecithin retinol acyltransferase family protein [Ralstonia pseudosolanacearum]
MNLTIEALDAWNERDCDAASGATLPLGAHLVTERKGYEHHGIYVGNGQVIHYAGFSRRQHRGPVEKISVARFACGFAVYIKFEACPRYDGEEVTRRAGSRLGENDYRLLTNNCEHFCSWCLFGECHSAQVEACLKNPVRAARTLFRLMQLALAVEWRSAMPEARAA